MTLRRRTSRHVDKGRRGVGRKEGGKGGAREWGRFKVEVVASHTPRVVLSLHLILCHGKKLNLTSAGGACAARRAIGDSRLRIP